jgi:hypothetical protein
MIFTSWWPLITTISSFNNDFQVGINDLSVYMGDADFEQENTVDLRSPPSQQELLFYD